MPPARARTLTRRARDPTMDEQTPPEHRQTQQPPAEERGIYLTLTAGMQALCAIGLLFFLIRRDWENVFLTVLVILLTLVPTFVWRRYRVVVPPEFQFTSALFVFLSLFLGSAADLYYRYW
jgi:hypothetical protein